MREIFLEDDEIRLILSFLPRSEDTVPEGLDPTFYHTLNYDKEVKLYARINDVRDKLTLDYAR